MAPRAAEAAASDATSANAPRRRCTTTAFYLLPNGPTSAAERLSSGCIIEAVKAVMLEVDPSLLEQRRRLGLDRFDEMWEGVLHMTPSPANEHQRIQDE